MRTTIVGFLSFAACWGSAGADMPRQEPESELPVVYTGRLLGYFRSPDKQAWTEGNQCPAFDLSDGSILDRQSPQVQTFVRLLRKAEEDPKKRVLVGVGDNFAPDFDARNFLPKDKAAVGKGEDYRDPKDMYYWSKDPRQQEYRWVRLTEEDPWNAKEAAANSNIEMDNVACFVRGVGYDALVPGKHDFYFGPERLRQIARFLAKQGTQMLAANLVIATTEPRAADRIPDRMQRQFAKEHGYTKAMPEPLNVDLPDAVLPWLRKVEVRGAVEELRDGLGAVSLRSIRSDERYSSPKEPAEVQLERIDKGVPRALRPVWNVSAVRVCAAETGDPEKISIPACMKAEHSTLAPELPGKRPSEDVAYAFDPKFTLEPGVNYGICLWPAGRIVSATPACALFRVKQPFFQYGDSKLLGDPPQPYVTKSVEIGGKKIQVAIFGVVESQIKDLVGALNYSWWNENKRYDTAIEAMDPVSALEQQLQWCDERPDCKDARRILLTQMPEERASLLAVRMPGRFEAIIAQTDSRHATDDQTTTRRPREGLDPERDFQPTFLLVPAYQYRSTPGELGVQIQKAVIAKPTRQGTPPCRGE